MYAYDAQALKTELSAIISGQVPAEAWAWLQQKSKEVEGTQGKMALNIAFAAVPRKVLRQQVVVDDASLKRTGRIRKGLDIQHWSLDRLCRVWVVLQVPELPQEPYVAMIEELFLAAEMNELVALYAALPVLAYPQTWTRRCAEGIRSNIGDVLEAIMCHNPYPAEYLDQAAWNQLVLKAIFTEKPLHLVDGLDERANQELADTLTDFAHERWAAHRDVPPMLWRCVGPFINEKSFPDIRRIAVAVDTTNREAAALACAMSNYAPAKEFLKNSRELQMIVASGTVSWETIAKKTELV